MSSNRPLEAPITLPTKEMKADADNLVQKINDHEEIISRGIAKLHQKEEKGPNSEEISEIQNLLLDRYKMLLETHIQLIRLESKYIDSEEANVNRKWKDTYEAANKEKKIDLVYYDDFVALQKQEIYHERQFLYGMEKNDDFFNNAFAKIEVLEKQIRSSLPLDMTKLITQRAETQMEHLITTKDSTRQFEEKKEEQITSGLSKNRF